MTVEEAVAILNRNNHRGRVDWRAAGYGVEVPGSPPSIFALSHFEAIAIAEAYLKKEEKGPLYVSLQAQMNHLFDLHNILEKRVRECEKTDYDKGLIGTTQTATGTQYHTIPEMIKAVEAKVDRLITFVGPHKL